MIMVSKDSKIWEIRFVAFNQDNGMYYDYCESYDKDYGGRAVCWRKDIRRARTYALPQHIHMSIKEPIFKLEILPVRELFYKKTKKHIWADKERKRLGLDYSNQDLPLVYCEAYVRR